MQHVEADRGGRRPLRAAGRGELLRGEEDEQGVGEIAGAEEPDRDEEPAVGGRQEGEPGPERDIGHRLALALGHEEADRGGGEEPRHEGEGEEGRVVVAGCG